MNLSDFKRKIKTLDQNLLKSILNGSALVMIQDKELGLGASNGAFVIFWIEDERFSSIDDLRGYLEIESEDLFISIYLFNDERNKKKNTENVISQLEISAFIIKAPAIILRTYKYERKNDF